MIVFALLGALVAQSLFGGLPIDGIHCDRQEGAVEHIHAQLQIFDRGHAVEIPANIGMPSAAACLYWVHTHSADGYIHIESPVTRPFTLGQFFDIWGPDLSWTQAATAVAPKGKTLAIWVNGVRWNGKDPRAIPLRDKETIVIQNGPPYGKPVPPDWTKL